MQDLHDPTSQPPRRRRRILALTLALIGLGYAANYALRLDWTPLWAPGLALLGWGAARQNTRPVIAGGILTGVGLSIALQSAPWVSTLTDQARTGLFMLCFALGWFLIPLVSGLALHRAVLWPLLPGLVMAISGGICWITDERAARLAGLACPSLFIIAGLLLLFGWNRTE